MVETQAIQSAIASILQAIGEDPGREGLRDTPQRVTRMYAELFSGVGVDPRSAIDAVFEEERLDQSVVILRDVPFFSMCEHHLLPFFGQAHIGYVPDAKVAGASKLARALEVAARKPQLQERLTAQLADAIHDVLHPDGTGVMIEAEHLCISMRGVKKAGSLVVTMATRGSFDKRGIDRSQFLAMLQGKTR
jgi:GTP cyclohydrolase I